jgi:type IV pilus assembly protein PilM
MFRKTTHKGPFIGLEIGSSAVRAAEVTGGSTSLTLQRFAEVALPEGAVEDGEVVDSDAVATALKRLWQEGKFTHRRVVVGISSQRVIVRQAELAAMSELELRSALHFEARELIPIPLEEAILDFDIVESHLPEGDHSDAPMMRVLLAAGHQDVVEGHLRSLRAAGLQPIAVDPVALAVLRAVPPALVASDPAAREGEDRWVEALITVDAPLTTVSIREGAIPRFVRVLNTAIRDTAIGLSTLSRPTKAPEDRPQTSFTAAEPAPVAVLTRPGPLAEDIRGSIDFYLAQSRGSHVDRVILIGGSSETEALRPQLEAALGRPVQVADPLAAVTLGKTAITLVQNPQARSYLPVSIGLASWGLGRRKDISLLPEGVLQAKRNRRHTVVAALVITSFAAALGSGWSARNLEVTRVRTTQHRAEAQITVLERQIAGLQVVTQMNSDIKDNRQRYLTALGKDVDTIRLLQQVAAVMPADVHLKSFLVQLSAGQAASSTQPSTGSTGDGVMTVTADATNKDSVAAWLRGLANIPGLQGAWVSSITQAPAGPAPSAPAAQVQSAPITFTSSANITPAAESTRGATALGSVQ